jgi:3-isopropylmalate dehydratase small subunit
MLPIALPQGEVDQIMKSAECGDEVIVDLPNQKIVLKDGTIIKFDIAPFRKHCLVNGLDDIGLTMEKMQLIEKFEADRSSRSPWLDGENYGSRVKPYSQKKLKTDW